MAGTPMFPLGMVLFPYTPLALRVFEPRYLTMVAALLDADEPDFGVVLIERGSETGGGDQRFGVGTLARLRRVVPQADQLTVVALGGRRIEVLEWLEEEPYPRAVLRELPELEWNDALHPMLTEAEAIVRRVLARLAHTGRTRWEPDVELTDSPEHRAWQVAALAPVAAVDQLELLRSPTMGGLLRATIDLTLAVEELLPLSGGEDPAGA